MSEPSANRIADIGYRHKSGKYEPRRSDVEDVLAALDAATARAERAEAVLRELVEAAGEMKHKRLQVAWRAAFALVEQPAAAEPVGEGEA